MRVVHSIVCAALSIGIATFEARADDIHLMCRSAKQTIQVDVNVDGLELSIKWPNGDTELFKNGRSSVAEGNGFGGDPCSYTRTDYVVGGLSR